MKVRSVLLRKFAVYIVICVPFLLQLVACRSAKKLVYFQEENSKTAGVPVADPYVPVIQKGDVLSVQVTSLNPQATVYFNPYGTIAGTMSQTPSSESSSSVTVPQALGYLVSREGNIELPLVGKVAVFGLTTAQAGERIRKSLSEYLKEPTVNIRNMSFRVSVLGEVARPTMLSVYNERITLTEALSLSGDITVYGRRDNVMVIREVKGERTFNRVNLNNRDLFRSPFYYLHPNDVVYIEPVKAKGIVADRSYQIIPFILSAISITVFLLRR